MYLIKSIKNSKNPIVQFGKLKILNFKNYQIFSSVQIILKNEKNDEIKKFV